MSLLIRIDRYLRRTGMPPSNFGRAVTNDPRLVSDLRRGRQPGVRVSARIRAYLDQGDA